MIRRVWMRFLPTLLPPFGCKRRFVQLCVATPSMPPTIRRFWPDCFKKDAVKSCPGVDAIGSFILSQSRVSAWRVFRLCEVVVWSGERVVHKIHKSVLRYRFMPSPKRAVFVAAPGRGRGLVLTALAYAGRAGR